MTELAILATRTGDVVLRPATAADLPALVSLLADDQLGANREEAGASDSELQPYRAAFTTIDADPAQLLLVGEKDGAVIATTQLSIIPGLARRGSARAQLEAVRVAAGHRDSGLGTSLVQWCIEYSRSQNCALVQLTSDKRRTEAHEFYRRLGFAASHEGFKLEL